MRSSRKFGSALFLFSGIGFFFGSFVSAHAGQPDIDSIVHDAALALMQQDGIPGLAIAITVDGHRRFYNYGIASRETGQTVTRDTLFELGSISKTFTATLATYAQAKGHLSLVDNPGESLPQLRDSHLDKVTLINLATHTAGGFPLQLPGAVGNTAQLMDYFRTWQPQYSAGVARTYANPSIGLLGMIAAKSMAMPFEAAIEQHLLPELGMFNTYLDVPAEKLPLYAQGYDKEDAPVRLNPGVLAAEAYGIKSSTRDLIRFVEANMRLVEVEEKIERALLDTRTGHFMIGPMTQDLVWEQYRYPVQLDALLEGNSSKMAYETNAAVQLAPPLSPQQAAWVNKTGSTNGFGAYVAFIPEEKIGIVMLANKHYPVESRIRLAYRIISALKDGGHIGEREVD